MELDDFRTLQGKELYLSFGHIAGGPESETVSIQMFNPNFSMEPFTVVMDAKDCAVMCRMLEVVMRAP